MIPITAPACPIDRAAWQAGFDAGQRGDHRPPPPGVDGYSLYSGRIEGDAARRETERR